MAGVEGDGLDAPRHFDRMTGQAAEGLDDLVVVVCLRDRRVLHCSPALARRLDTVAGNPDGWSHAFVADDRPNAMAAFARAAAEGQASAELRAEMTDGTMRHVCARFFRSDGDATTGPALVMVAMDIDEALQLRQSLQEYRERFDGIVGSAMDAIVCADARQVIVMANPAADKMFGYAPGALLGQSLNVLIPQRFRTSHVHQVEHYGQSGQSTRHMGALRTVYGRRRDGSEFPLEVSISRNATAGGMFFTSIIRDNTESVRSRREIDRLNRLYATLSAINQLIVRARRSDDLFAQACRIAVEQGGYQRAWIGRIDRLAGKVVPEASAGFDAGFLASVHDDFPLHSDTADDAALVAQAVREGQPIVRHDPSRGAFGSDANAIASRAVLPLHGDAQTIGVFVLHSQDPDSFEGEQMRLLHELAGDVSFAIDHIAKSDHLDYLSHYDVLTGLALPSLWSDRLQQRLEAQPEATRTMAVFALDIEHFRAINEALGRQIGDEVLRAIAGRFRQFDDEHHSRFCRAGEDRFAVFAAALGNAERVAHYLEGRLDAVFHAPVHVGGTDIRVAVKVGVALYPDDGGDAETLLRNAEAALKRAKTDGRRYLFFSADMTARVAERLALESRLRQAIDRDEFELYYQAKATISDGRPTGCEALIRWNDPSSGVVEPAHFIPVLEATGLILEVGRWVLRQAVADYLHWRDSGLAALPIAVNVSPLQLRDRGFAAEVAAILGVDRRAAAGIELEITESAIMDDAPGNVAILQSIRALGTTIAIDDFGTGYSSLSYLLRLPVDTLKIDRSFIVEMEGNANALGLVSTIISLAHLMGLKVVAEGVESERQRQLLRTLRCDQMQGFVLAKPMPRTQFEQRFLSQSALGGREFREDEGRDG